MCSDSFLYCFCKFYARFNALQIQLKYSVTWRSARKILTRLIQVYFTNRFHHFCNLDHFFCAWPNSFCSSIFEHWRRGWFVDWYGMTWNKMNYLHRPRSVSVRDKRIKIYTTIICFSYLWVCRRPIVNSVVEIHQVLLCFFASNLDSFFLLWFQLLWVRLEDKSNYRPPMRVK